MSGHRCSASPAPGRPVERARAALSPAPKPVCCGGCARKIAATALSGNRWTRSRLRVTLVVVLEPAVLVRAVSTVQRADLSFLSCTIGHPVTHAQTVQAIYNVFFASLMMMLDAFLGHHSLQRAVLLAEAEFLLTTPVRPERIVLHKFQEAIVFSSWGFLLLGSPMLVAYGLQRGAPWYYFVLLAAVHGGFHLHSRRHRCHPVHAVRASPGAIHAGTSGCRLIVLAIVVAIVLLCWSLLGKTEGNLLTPRLVSGDARPIAIQRASAAAELVAQLGTARSGPHAISGHGDSWAESLLFLSLLDLQRPVLARAGRGGWARGSIAPATASCAPSARAGGPASDSGSTAP